MLRPPFRALFSCISLPRGLELGERQLSNARKAARYSVASFWTD